MPGPAKRSNAHKRKTGSRHTHTGEDLTPEILTKVPSVPKDLGEHAKAEWKRICRLLVEQEILTEMDLATIKIMCQEYERYCRALIDIEENGEFQVTQTGYEQVRPSSGIRNQAFANYTRLLRHFGGDTEARAKIKRVRPQVEEKSKFDDI